MFHCSYKQSKHFWCQLSLPHNLTFISVESESDPCCWGSISIRVNCGISQAAACSCWYSLIRYELVSKSFRTGRLERELQMVQFSTTECSFVAILWVSLVNFSAITVHVASQRVFIVVSVYFVIDAVRKLLDTTSYILVATIFMHFSL
jgi:hypothetical protein